MKEQTFSLPHELYSPDQLSEIIFELRSYKSALRSSLARKGINGHDSLATEPSTLLLKTNESAGLNLTSLEDMESLQQKLEIIRNNAPKINFILAAAPNQQLKHRLTKWFRINIHPHVFLTFAARSDICGGYILEAGSHIYNHSFRNLIINNRQKIAEFYHNVQ